MTKTVPTRYSRCMTIYKRREVYWSKVMRGGELHRVSLGVTRLSDARRLETALKTRVAEGKFGIVQPPTFEEFCIEFLNYASPRVKSASFLAYTKATVALCSLPDLAASPLDKINMKIVDQFVAVCREQDQAVATINLRIRVLRRILHVALERELITKVPRLHTLRGANVREEILSEADEARMVDAVEHPTMRHLIPFLTATALRISEAVALTWADVEDGVVQVRAGKTRCAKRSIPLSKKAVEALSGMRNRTLMLGKSVQPPSPIFIRTVGNPISQVWAAHLFRVARIKLGLPDGLVLHSTRHTALTRWAASGMSPFVLQKLAGHSDIGTSSKYCHPDAKAFKDAIDRLNKEEK